MKIDTNDLALQDSSHLLSDIVVPRPIAWVSTVDKNGVFNLAPFSCYGLVSGLPMVVGFSVGSYRDGQKKDTLRNIELTNDFVINVVTENLASAMNVTSAPYPSEVSEFVKAGLTPVKADIVNAPMVAEVACQDGMPRYPNYRVRKSSCNQQPHSGVGVTGAHCR